MKSYYCRECGIKINPQNINQPCPACSCEDFIKKICSPEYQEEIRTESIWQKKEETLLPSRALHSDSKKKFKDIKIQFECHDCNHIFTSHVKESMCPSCKSEYILKTEELYAKKYSYHSNIKDFEVTTEFKFFLLFFICFFISTFEPKKILLIISLIVLFFLLKSIRYKRLKRKTMALLLKQKYSLLVTRDHAVIWSDPSFNRVNQIDLVKKGFRIEATEKIEINSRNWFLIHYNEEPCYILSDDITDLKYLLDHEEVIDMYISGDSGTNVYETPSGTSKVMQKIERGTCIHHISVFKTIKPSFKQKSDSFYCQIQDDTWFIINNGTKPIGYGLVNDFLKIDPWVLS